ncbi:EAL domain-containing protein [Nautilia sp.]
MRTIKNEMIKLFIVSGIGLLVLLYIAYKSVTYVVINQEYQKAKLLAHTLVYTRDYIAKVAPYIKIENNAFHPFAITPAVVVGQITTIIKNKEHFEVKQTSDRYRNKNNKPNKYDLEAINFFRKNPFKEDYFALKTIGSKDYLFYAYPLKTEKSCLKCHGSVKEIPNRLYEKLVRVYGKRAFGYKLGELRGVISIRLPFDDVGYKIRFLFEKLALFLLVIYIIGVIVFLRINTMILKDIEKINGFMKKNLSNNIFRPMKESLIFYELEKIKNQINDTVKSIKKFKRDSYSNFYYHPLSKLPNRTKMMEVLKRKKSCILLFDIDSFKEINYYYGEEIADKLILQAVKRIKKYKPFHVKIDQFALLVFCREKNEIEQLAKKILKELEQPYNIDAINIYVKFRVGIAFGDREFKDALNALEATKILNRDIVFSNEIKNIKDVSKRHIQLIKKLKIAIEQNKLIPYFQPIVDRNKKICKYEALIRLIDESGKTVLPGDFLEIAKKSRLYFEITKQVIEKSFRVFENTEFEFSVNLSTMDMENENIKEFILNRLYGFTEPKRVSFEIVESENIKNSETVFEFIKELKRLGCKILIDDFGSGYANFDYLLSLGADGLKIDGSLIKNILSDKKSEIIVKTIVNFAKEVDMRVIAEYVENDNIFEFLKNLGIDCYQGYFYSTPKPYI